MDRGEEGRGPTRVLIVEDRVSYTQSALGRAVRVVGPGGRRAEVVAALDHGQVLGGVAHCNPDVALVDAMRHPDDLLADPSVLRFAGLPIAQLLHEEVPGCRVVGYSAHAEQPWINIAFREVPSVAAVYGQASLVEHLDEVLWSDGHPHQIPPPTAADYQALGLGPEAQLWSALRLAMERPDTWEAVARVHGYRGIENRTREHLNKYLPTLLPMREATTYRAYVDLLRRVAGFA